MKYIAIILLAILSGCGVRKVQTNKSITEIKETSVHAVKTDSTAVNVVKQEVKEKETEHFVDTTKKISENKTVIEFFGADGKLTKRITSSTNKQIKTSLFSQKSINKQKTVVDSSYFTAHSEIKDSTVVDTKKVEKVKQSEAKRPNFLIFGIVLCFVGWAAYMLLRK